MEYEKRHHLQLIENQKHRRVFQDEDHILTVLLSTCWPNFPRTLLSLILSKPIMVMSKPKFKCA